MNFLHQNFLIPIIICLAIFSFFYIKNYLKFHLWIKRYWGVRLKTKGYLSLIFFLSGMAMLGLTLLDPRGETQNIKATIKETKTIIMIDNSASMLAEDVRPNRLEKAVFLARHFTKSAVGHQISVVVFSDIQKKIVPFTADRELLDSRLETIVKGGAIGGGTNLSLSIQEAITYFSQEENQAGNLLIYTDAEESDSPIDLKIPKDINVAVVALGTAKGATIPVRNRNGQLQGNKKINGEEVVTKLNTAALDALGKQITNFKYWVANSYALPTQDILKFFSAASVKNAQRDDMKIRPVLAHYFQLPGIILLILSLLLKFGKNFAPLYLLLLMFCFPVEFLRAQEDKKIEINPADEKKITEILDRYRKGYANSSELSELASIYMKNKMYDKAKTLFEKNNLDKKDLNNEFNYATTLLNAKEPQKAYDRFLELNEKLKKSDDEKDKKMLEDIKKNLAMSGNGSGKNNQKQKGESGENSEEKSDESESGDSKDQKNKPSDKKNEEKKDDKKDDKKDKDKEKDEKDKKEQEQKQPQQGESQKPMEQKKVPGMLKQLMDEDRKLQTKFMDTNTDQKNKNYRDW